MSPQIVAALGFSQSEWLEDPVRWYQQIHPDDKMRECRESGVSVVLRVLLSVTEGEDQPLKYPTIFNSADVAIITKSDLAAAVEFDEPAARRNIQAVRPGMEIFKLSAKTGEGMADYLEFLERRRTSFSARVGVFQSKA